MHVAEPLRAGDRGELEHARVIAPLVHHEEPVAPEFAQADGLACVRAERLLDEDRHAVVERRLHDLCMRARGGRDDDPVDVLQLRDVSDDGAGAAVPRARDARLGARHDRHGAAERTEVAEDVRAPATAPDEAHDHGGP